MVVCVCTVVIRIALGILNSLMLIMSVLTFSGGVMLVMEGGKILNRFVDVDKAADKLNLDQDKIPDISWLEDLPMGRVGWWMCGASTCLAALASLGLGAAIRPGNKVMLSFTVIVTIIALLCITLGGLFLNSDSSIHNFLREQASDLLHEKYGKDGYKTFSKAIDGLHYFVECCGVQGPEDFGKGPPASCCDHTEMSKGCNQTELAGFNQTKLAGSNQTKLGGRNATGTVTENFYKQKGCYDMVLDLVVKNKGLVAFYGIFVSMLVEEAVLGVLYLIFDRLTPGSK